MRRIRFVSHLRRVAAERKIAPDRAVAHGNGGAVGPRPSVVAALIIGILTVLLYDTSAAVADPVKRNPSARTKAVVPNGSAPKIKVAEPKLKVGDVIKDCPDCPEMVAVPEVSHDVDNPGAIFLVGRYEITWRQYIRAVQDGVCPPLHIRARKEDWPPPQAYSAITDDYPLTLVSPQGFNCFLAWMKIKTGRVYSLPTAAQWEHFARAGVRAKYPWGDELGFDRAALVISRARAPDVRLYDVARLVARYGIDRNGGLNLRDPRFQFQRDDIWPVGSFPPNAWGLYDTIGNAEEVTTEPYGKCIGVHADVCDGLATRGTGYVPEAQYTASDFSVFTFRGFAFPRAGTGAAGYRLIRQ